MSIKRVTRFNEGEFKGCLNLEGTRFGKLKVEKILRKTKQGAVWLCSCDCGNDTEVLGKRPNMGIVNSCGCSAGAKTHGMSYSKEYRAWRSMQDRCYNENTLHFNDYGGRGIKVCDSWLESFENFYRDMGEAPEGMSLDRIDVNGNYCKENCRWATQSVQVFNTRKQSKNTSGRSGVDFHKSAGKWRARITVNLEHIHLGLFDTFEQACLAREEAETKYFGFTKE